MANIYLDHAAATALDPYVLGKMLPYLQGKFYNPSATYLAAKAIRQDIEEARARTAAVLGVRPREIIFTAGATEANNLAIQGVMQKFPGKKVLVSATEHSSVLEPAKKYNHTLIPINSTGHVDLVKLEKLLADDEVVLVSIMYANNEIGTVNKLSDIKKIIEKAIANRQIKGIDVPIYFHTDAAQAPNYLSILAKKIGVDLMSLNGSKIYGPKQSGALYIATGTLLEPLILGGGQEWGLRSGTENVAGIIGFSYALEKASQLHHQEFERNSKLKDKFIKLLEDKIPNIEINSKEGLANIIHVSIPGTDNERLMMELDEAGIQCAVGSACSASSDEPSHVLKAIGLTDTQAQTSLRFSLGRENTEADIQKTVDAMLYCL